METTTRPIVHRNNTVTFAGIPIGRVARRVYEATPGRYRSEYVACDRDDVIVAVQGTKALAVKALASRVGV